MSMLALILSPLLSKVTIWLALVRSLVSAKLMSNWFYQMVFSRHLIPRSLPCSLIESSLTEDSRVDKQDGVYNYAKILCHYESLAMEFRDAWHEGDGERVLRCWKCFCLILSKQDAPSTR